MDVDTVTLVIQSL